MGERRRHGERRAPFGGSDLVGLREQEVQAQRPGILPAGDPGEELVVRRQQGPAGVHDQDDAPQQGTLEEVSAHERSLLRGVVLVMDARRPLLAADHELLSWITRREDAGTLRLHLLLTKADQVGTAEGRSALAMATELAHGVQMPTSVQLFSALKRQGLEELREAAAQILEDG